MKIQKRRYNNAHTNRDKHNGASGAFGGGKRPARGKHMLCVRLGSGGRDRKARRPVAYAGLKGTLHKGRGNQVRQIS